MNKIYEKDGRIYYEKDGRIYKSDGDIRDTMLVNMLTILTNQTLFDLFTEEEKRMLLITVKTAIINAASLTICEVPSYEADEVKKEDQESKKFKPLY